MCFYFVLVYCTTINYLVVVRKQLINYVCLSVTFSTSMKRILGIIVGTQVFVAPYCRNNVRASNGEKTKTAHFSPLFPRKLLHVRTFTFANRLLIKGMKHDYETMAGF